MTLSRIGLSPFVAWTIWNGAFQKALALLAIAAVTDGLDGFLARQFGWFTRLGAYLDPIADKMLLSFGYLALGAAGAVPWWLVGVIFGRDVLILLVSALFLLAGTRRDFPPSIWGKLSTFIQIACAVAVLSIGAWSGPGALPRLAPLWAITAAATVWSGVHYALRAARR